MKVLFNDFFNFLRKKDIAVDKYKKEKEDPKRRNYKASRKSQTGGTFKVGK